VTKRLPKYLRKGRKYPVILGIRLSEDDFGSLLRAARRDRRPPGALARIIIEEYLGYAERKLRRSAGRAGGDGASQMEVSA
jgi:hypothetical protein